MKESAGGRDPCTTVQLSFGPGAPREARRLMVADLEAAGLRDSVIVDAQLVLAELAANGIEHGRPNDDGTIEISWCVHDDRLRISVVDGGTVATLSPLELTDERARGRGLAIIDKLCDRWNVENQNGTRITAEIDYSPPTPGETEHVDS